jgi:hypothetical protein
MDLLLQQLYDWLPDLTPDNCTYPALCTEATSLTSSDPGLTNTLTIFTRASKKHITYQKSPSEK